MSVGFQESGSVGVSFSCRLESALWDVLVENDCHSCSHQEASDVGPEGDAGVFRLQAFNHLDSEPDGEEDPRRKSYGESAKVAD